mgnify:CR=1 FL=1
MFLVRTLLSEGRLIIMNDNKNDKYTEEANSSDKKNKNSK